MLVFKATMLAIVKWVSIFSIGFLILFGATSTYDALVGDGKIPQPKFVGIDTKESHLVYECSPIMIDGGSSDEDCWENLEGTMVLMDKVVPHVARWMREQKSAGKVSFELSETERWAYYDVVTGKLHVSGCLLNQRHGEKCAILAHEWRHSRQNKGKWVKRLVACMFGRDNEEIIENDAYMYQYLVEKEMLQPIFTKTK